MIEISDTEFRWFINKALNYVDLDLPDNDSHYQKISNLYNCYVIEPLNYYGELKPDVFLTVLYASIYIIKYEEDKTYSELLFRLKRADLLKSMSYIQKRILWEHIRNYGDFKELRPW